MIDMRYTRRFASNSELFYINIFGCHIFQRCTTVPLTWALGIIPIKFGGTPIFSQLYKESIIYSDIAFRYSMHA
jgi:hypothetical protein